MFKYLIWGEGVYHCHTAIAPLFFWGPSCSGYCGERKKQKWYPLISTSGSYQVLKEKRFVVTWVNMIMTVSRMSLTGWATATLSSVTEPHLQLAWTSSSSCSCSCLSPPPVRHTQGAVLRETWVAADQVVMWQLSLPLPLVHSQNVSITIDTLIYPWQTAGLATVILNLHMKIWLKALSLSQVLESGRQ